MLLQGWCLCALTAFQPSLSVLCAIPGVARDEAAEGPGPAGEGRNGPEGSGRSQHQHVGALLHGADVGSLEGARGGGRGGGVRPPGMRVCGRVSGIPREAGQGGDRPPGMCAGVGFVIGIWQAPWIQGMNLWWFDEELMSTSAYEATSFKGDLMDHSSLFWTPASGK